MFSVSQLSFLSPHLARAGQNEVSYQFAGLELERLYRARPERKSALGGAAGSMSHPRQKKHEPRATRRFPKSPAEPPMQLFSGSPTSKFSIVDAGTGIGDRSESARSSLGSGRRSIRLTFLILFSGTAASLVSTPPLPKRASWLGEGIWPGRVASGAKTSSPASPTRSSPPSRLRIARVMRSGGSNCCNSRSTSLENSKSRD